MREFAVVISFLQWISFSFNGVACIKIPREDLLGRLENEMNFEKEHPQEEDDVPLFQAAVEASRGDWDAVNSSMLSKSDKEGLESTKRRFESNKKDVMKKYKERLQGDPKARKPFQEDRCLHLDNIVRWIFCRRDESLDPTGEFRTIDAEVLQRPKEQLWLRAKLLEVRLHAKHRLEYSTDDKSPHEEHSSSKKVINLEEQQEEMQHFQEDRITVDNGKWDDVLSDEDQIQLVELKRKFRLNVKDAFRKYKKKLGDDLKARKPFLGDRCLDLDHIVRWICGGKNRSDDPTGKFHSIDDGLSPSSNKPLWKRAKEIEARLRSSRIKKSNAEQASLQKTVAHVVDDFCDADIASEMGYNKEELKMYKDVMCWLQDRQDVYDPTGEFSDIDKKLEKSVFEDTESKAKEMVSRICIMRRLFGDWLGIGSADGKPAASPGRRKQSKATTKKIVSPSDKLHRDALRWLKKKTEKNDPTGEFCDIDSRLPPSDNQGISDRARDMVVRIELLRTCLGEWLQQQSDETASGEAKVSEISGATKNMRSSPRKAIGEEDKKRLESLKNRFKSNVKDDLKKYQMRLKKNPNARKPFKGDRGLDLDNIVNWICCGKKQSADPTGEFRSFDTEIPPSPYKPLWSRAMEIERGLRKMKMRKFLQECQDMQHPREDHDTAADHMIADQSLPNEIEQKQEKQHPREDHYTIDCGKWDKVLGDKDMRRLKTLKKKFDWNEKEALRKYNIKLKNNPEARRKSFHGDRWLDLSRILNWICGGGKESDDPTGEFRSIDAEISPSPHEPLWSRARDIERELRSFHVKKHKAQFKEHPQRGHDAIADQSPPNKAIARDEEKHETQHPQEDHDMAADHMIDDHSSPMEVEQKYEKQHPQRGGDKIADRSPPNKAIARDEEKHETQHPQEDHDTVADHMIAERSFPKEVEHKHEKQHPQRGHGTISDQSSTNKVITRDDEKNGTQHAQENHESAADHMIDEQSSTKEVEQKQEKQHPREDHYTTKSGKWDNVLGDEGKAYLMEWQQRFEKNCRDATRLYEKKLKQNPEARQPFQGDRLLDLNCIVNWICGGKNKSDDPTGEFCSIDAEISPSPEEPIWIRAKDIETKLRLLRVKKYHKELSQKESSETERKGKKNQTSPSLAKRPRTNQSEESTSDNPSNKNQISSRQVKKPRTDTIELAADNPVAFSPVEFAGSADQLLANLVVHARLFQQLGVSKEEYQMFLQDYRDKYGLGRCSALNSICGWLALDDPSLDQTGEFRMLHGIFSPSPRSPILDRAIQLEVLLYGLRLQPWGDDWTENPSAATLYVRGSLARWEREGYRNAIPPVCVSPSPPNSLYEGFAGRAILEMQAQLQRHVPSTPVIRPKTDSPIGGTTLSPAVAFARTNVPWVTVQKDSNPERTFY